MRTFFLTTNQPILHYSSPQRLCLRPITYLNFVLLSPGCLVFLLSIHTKTPHPPSGQCRQSKKPCWCLRFLRLEIPALMTIPLLMKPTHCCGHRCIYRVYVQALLIILHGSFEGLWLRLVFVEFQVSTKTYSFDD